MNFILRPQKNILNIIFEYTLQNMFIKMMNAPNLQEQWRCARFSVRAEGP